MKEFWNMIQLVFTMIGGWLGYFLGGCDGLLLALVVFVVMDYVTGVMCAVADRTLSSEVGFKGICRKILIFMLVGVANVLDVHIIGTGSVIRTAVIFFYLSNEGISLLENAAHLGLPVPEKLKLVLEQLHQRAESGDVSAVAVKDADDAAGTEDAGEDADDSGEEAGDVAGTEDIGEDADVASGDEEGSDV
jgi:toxin secretion/phage lysis holin